MDYRQLLCYNCLSYEEQKILLWNVIRRLGVSNEKEEANNVIPFLDWMQGRQEEFALLLLAESENNDSDFALLDETIQHLAVLIPLGFCMPNLYKLFGQKASFLFCN